MGRKVCVLDASLLLDTCCACAPTRPSRWSLPARCESVVRADRSDFLTTRAVFFKCALWLLPIFLTPAVFVSASDSSDEISIILLSDALHVGCSCGFDDCL